MSEESTFLLIRHAEAPWSEDEGRPLSRAGMEAAVAFELRLLPTGAGAFRRIPEQKP